MQLRFPIEAYSRRRETELFQVAFSNRGQSGPLPHLPSVSIIDSIGAGRLMDDADHT